MQIPEDKKHEATNSTTGWDELINSLFNWERYVSILRALQTVALKCGP